MSNTARHHRWSTFLLFVSCLFALSTAAAQTPNYDNPLRIESRSSLHVGLENLGPRGADAGLSWEGILDHISFRLFQNGIHFDPQARREPLSPTLYVNFNIINGAASISLDFSRWVSYDVDGVEHRTSASVWRAGLVARLSTSLNRSDGEYLMDALDRLLADFVRDFLRDNR